MTRTQSPVLTALRDDLKPGMHTIEPGTIIIGRLAELCQIVVSDKKVSRIHASIQREGMHCYLEDRKSANRTYVNGRRICDRYLLKDQDEIGLGPGPALFRFDDFDPTERVLPQLYFDEAAMKFYLNKQRLQLAPHGFRLLFHLYKHMGELCLHKGCAEVVWEREFDPDSDIDGLHKLVTRIRKKLGDIDPEARQILVSRRGMGYQLDIG